MGRTQQAVDDIYLEAQRQKKPRAEIPLPLIVELIDVTTLTASTCFQLKQLDAAKKNFLHALKFLEPLVPNSPQFQVRLADLLTGLGDVFEAEGNMPEALGTAKRALMLVNKLLPFQHPVVQANAQRLSRLQAMVRRARACARAPPRCTRSDRSPPSHTLGFGASGRTDERGRRCRRRERQRAGNQPCPHCRDARIHRKPGPGGGRWRQSQQGRRWRQSQQARRRRQSQQARRRRQSQQARRRLRRQPRRKPRQAPRRRG